MLFPGSAQIRVSRFLAFFSRTFLLSALQKEWIFNYPRRTLLCVTLVGRLSSGLLTVGILQEVARGGGPPCLVFFFQQTSPRLLSQR